MMDCGTHPRLGQEEASAKPMDIDKPALSPVRPPLADITNRKAPPTVSMSAAKTPQQAVVLKPLEEYSAEGIAKLTLKQLKLLCSQHPRKLKTSGNKEQLVKACQTTAILLQQGAELPNLTGPAKPATAKGSGKKKIPDCPKHIFCQAWGRCMLCGAAPEGSSGLPPSQPRPREQVYGVPNGPASNTVPGHGLGAKGSGPSKTESWDPRKAPPAEINAAKGPKLKLGLKVLGFTISKPVPEAKEVLISYGEALRMQEVTAAKVKARKLLMAKQTAGNADQCCQVILTISSLLTSAVV
jgi:hypothetical protein